MKKVIWLIAAETTAYLILAVYPLPSIDFLGFNLVSLEQGRIWTLLTSLFVHVSPVHLGLNMFLLYVFGVSFEDEAGGLVMLLIFFLGGIGSLILSIPIYSTGTTIIGSSVGVSAVAGAALTLRPTIRLPVYLFRAPAGLFAMVYLVLNVMLALFDRSGLIAYPSHVIAIGLGLGSAIVFSRVRRRDKGLN